MNRNAFILALALAALAPRATLAQTATPASAPRSLAATPVSAPAAKAAPAKAAPAVDGKDKSNSPLSGFGSNSKEPYKIDANTLEVSQKDNKATYAGDVVVINGKTTMRCTTLHIFFNQKKDEPKPAGGATAPKASAAAQAAQPGAGGLKRLECHGPVSVQQEKQTATSKLLVYENDIVTLTGDVIVADGDNVQAGEKLVYDTKSGVGKMEGSRIRGIFLPGSGDKDPAAKKDKKPKTN